MCNVQMLYKCTLLQWHFCCNNNKLLPRKHSSKTCKCIRCVQCTVHFNLSVKWISVNAYFLSQSSQCIRDLKNIIPLCLPSFTAPHLVVSIIVLHLKLHNISLRKPCIEQICHNCKCYWLLRGKNNKGCKILTRRISVEKKARGDRKLHSYR